MFDAMVREGHAHVANEAMYVGVLNAFRRYRLLAEGLWCFELAERMHARETVWDAAGRCKVGCNGAWTLSSPARSTSFGFNLLRQ
jgi:hypothetical protein